MLNNPFFDRESVVNPTYFNVFGAKWILRCPLDHAQVLLEAGGRTRQPRSVQERGHSNVLASVGAWPALEVWKHCVFPYDISM